ncbi:MAG: hypothetical protein QOG22_3908, partial [Pseudonocardiales bacterium]|nr:hypothetical protein [Pseudonocardiales bacterium]
AISDAFRSDIVLAILTEDAVLRAVSGRGWESLRLRKHP